MSDQQNISKQAAQTAYLDYLSKTIYTAILEDILMKSGYPNQALPPNIKALDPSVVVVGRAATMEAVPVDEASDSKPFGLSLEFLDSLTPGEVVMISAKSDAPASLWGEIMSTAAQAHGARGVIVDGYGRDTSFIRDIEFPSFFAGLTPAGSVGRLEVQSTRTSITIGNTTVEPGQLVVADADGVVVVPKDIEEEVIEQALQDIEAETAVRAELRAGASVVEVYNKYGVL